MPNDQLIGVWNGSAYPTQETTLALFGDGRGLLFYYHGSDKDTPFVDEFSWSAVREGTLEVKWQVLHTNDRESDSKDDGSDGPPLIVRSGIAEEIDYDFVDGLLDISLGLHDGYFTKLHHVDPLSDYDVEHQRLTELAANFDPFGPDRMAWDVSVAGAWRKLPQESLANRAVRWLISLFQLGLIFGL